MKLSEYINRQNLGSTVENQRTDAGSALEQPNQQIALSTPDRRTFLKTAGATAAVGALAGCLGSSGTEQGASGEAENCEEPAERTVLPEPENGVPVDDPPFPTPGEPIPELTVPAPLHDREVTTTEFVCDRHQLYTFIFTRCHEACPALTSTLSQVHADSITEGYEDEIAFVQITFDPEHDTPDVIAAYEEGFGVDPDPGHWYTLRPETEERAKAVVHDSFGQEYTKTGDDDHEDGHGEHEDDDDGMDPGDLDGIGDEVGDDGEGDDDHGDDHDMPFMHISLVLLVNKAGYVERAYAYNVPNPTVVIDDTQDLVEAW